MDILAAGHNYGWRRVTVSVILLLEVVIWKKAIYKNIRKYEITENNLR